MSGSQPKKGTVDSSVQSRSETKQCASQYSSCDCVGSVALREAASAVSTCAWTESALSAIHHVWRPWVGASRAGWGLQIGGSRLGAEFGA